MSYSSRLRARERELGRPVRVALVGAGQMGRGFAAQLLRMPGITLSAVVDVDIDRAREAIEQSGVSVTSAASTAEQVAVVEAGGSVAVAGTDSLTELPVDVVVEATGVPDVGARVALQAMLAGKHVATLNVESDVTVGRLLAAVSDATGSLYSVCRGDEPVEAKILVDYARDLSFEVVCAGKGKNNPLDVTANPDTLKGQAAAKQMNPKMLCSFVDGSKAMIEMASLANTTGLGVSTRGMHGPASTVPTLHETFALTSDGGVLEKPGVVDYCTGPVAPGVFVIVRTDDPYVNHEMTYLQMGDGPYFTLYRPFHLASIEAPLTVCELVLDERPSLTAEHWTAEVGAVAKRDLASGERIDGVGGFMVRGMIDDSDTFRAERSVPLGVLAGATLRRPVEAGKLLTYDDVDLDETSTIVALRRLQDTMTPDDDVLALVASTVGAA